MKDSISSTLFRFVSLRSPKLLDEPTKEIKFVQLPTLLQEGIFYEAIRDVPEGTSKKSALLRAATDFKDTQDCFTSLDTIIGLNSRLYDFSTWLISNRSTCTESELLERASSVSEPLNNEVRNDLHNVWNNLFYQVISQKSFKIKEALMGMLIADHFISKYKRTGGEEYNLIIAKSRVVLPGILFDENAIVKSDVIENTAAIVPVLPDKQMKRKLAISKATFSNESIRILKKELEILEKDYREAYTRAYERDFLVYQDSIAPKWKTYYEDLEVARKNYCTVDYKPDRTFNGEDPCQQPDFVPYPEISDFEFTFSKEIDPTELEQKLTYKSYTTLLDISGYKFDVFQGEDISQRNALAPRDLLSDYQDYGSIYQQIDISIGDNNQTIIDNTLPAEQIISIGGIATPVSEIPNLPIDRYSICSAQSGYTFIYTLNVGVPELWSVVSINVTRKNSDSSVENYTIYAPDATRVGYSLQLTSFLSYTFPNSVLQDGPVFDFLLNFSNGNGASVSKRIVGFDTMSVLKNCVRGFMTDKGDAPEVPIETPSFIPSGFGLKQIGIADYLKVEQTVQCYLEGEVSHIENIMAREYKEKATRRLSRTEDTTTLTSETEREQLTDTTSTDRFEMQTEVSKVIQQTKDLAGTVNSGFNSKGFFLNAGISFSNSTSTENSIFQAVTEAQEITERALDRVVSKVKEERIQKVIEEFEENNKHGFDNRKGNKHVVGVYRWIDKLYKNQIYNYGKRMMFEFMIPDPSKLHLLGVKEEMELGTIITDLTPPADPRAVTGNFRMEGYSSVTETKAAYWAGVFNAEIKAKPVSQISVGESFSIDVNGGAKLGYVETKSGNGKVTIPEGYMATRAVGVFNAVSDGHSSGGRILSLTIGNKTKKYTLTFGSYSLYLNTSLINSSETTSGENFVTMKFGNEIPVSYTLGNHASGDISVSVTCVLTPEAENQWKQETFKAIMDAYYEALEEYNRKIESETAIAVETKKTNPGFYRQIENTILRKNCISYIISQNPLAQYTYGKDLSNGGTTFGSYEIDLTNNLDHYASFVKFIEQAFEWEIMSYNFYPYYWSPRGSWIGKYNSDVTDDPTFRAFIQSGMARVIVTVRPGFEEAVQLYMSTGQTWNGGQVPIIGDDMFVDIIAEIQNIKKEKQGKAWLSRVPTSLTILQAQSIGLVVEKALPCNCDDTDDFENPEEVPCSDSFKLNDNIIGGDDGPEIPAE